MSNENNDLVQLSSKKFLGLCVLLSAGVLWLGARQPLPGWVMAAEVLVTILALFVTGSIRYRLDKNALTYGAGLVITATFWTFWSPLKKAAVAAEGGSFGEALWHAIRHHALTFEGINHLVHLDTMLFILGLTFFVAVIAQTRLLETISFGVLTKSRGRLVPTVAFLTAVVALVHWWSIGQIPLLEALRQQDDFQVGAIRRAASDLAPSWVNYAGNLAIKALLPFALLITWSRQRNLFWVLCAVGLAYSLSVIQKSYVITLFVPLWVSFLIARKWVAWASLSGLFVVIIGFMSNVADH